jgi:transglutaminase-like putative cysteine protease
MNDNYNRLVLGLLLWLQGLFVAATFQTWQPVLIAAVLTTMVVAIRHSEVAFEIPPLESFAKSFFLFRSRWGRGLSLAIPVLLIVLVTLRWRLVAQSDRDVNLLSAAIDAIAHVSWFTALMLWVWRPQRGHFLMLGLGMVVLLLAVAAGGTSRSMAAQTSVALAACVGFSVGSQVILGSARQSRRSLLMPSQAIDAQGQWIVVYISLITVSLILTASGAIASVTSRVLPGFQQSIQQRLNESLEAVVDRTGIGGTRYVRSGRLGAVRDHILSSPTDISLIVDSRTAPGYLRGNAFDAYEHRQWFSAARRNASASVERTVNSDVGQRTIRPSSQGRASLDFPLARPLKRFLLHPENQQMDTAAQLTVYGSPIKGYVVFTPLDTLWIEGRARELSVSRHDVVGNGIDITIPYVVGVGARSRRDSLSAADRQILTSVPASLAREAERVAREVRATSGSAIAKAAAVSQYFQAGSDYSLRPPNAPPGVDPIAFFLRQRHPAHCEYFASATAVVLRAAGVPARYVTGYIVDEQQSEPDDRWIARNRDAHAWVEAYDDRSGRWFAVESTPGRTYQTIADPSDSRNQSFWGDESVDDSESNRFSLLQQVWGWLASFRLTDAFYLVFQFAQLPLLISLVALWWFKYKRPRVTAAHELDLRSLRMLRQADRKVKRHSLVRRPQETIHQFADRIETSSLEFRGDYADWYRQYAVARYCGRMPAPLTDLLI